MDEVFNGNHVATIPVLNNLKGRNDQKNIAQCHEYLVVYDKGKFISHGLPLSARQLKDFKNIDENGERYSLRDLRKRGGADTRLLRGNLFFPIFYDQLDKSFSLTRRNKSDVEILPMKSDGVEGCWRWGKGKVSENLSFLAASYVKSSDKWNIGYRVYLNPPDSDADGDEEESGDDWNEDAGTPFDRSTKSKSFWWGPEISSDLAGKHLKKILEGTSAKFDHPKSPWLIQKVISMASRGDDIIMDSFAGSGTTAEAVLTLNKLDGRNRKFILVETEDYADTVTAERVHLVIKGVPDSKDEALKNGLGGSFTFCTLGDEINIESLLKDGKLPEYEALARYVFYTATGQTLDTVGKHRPDFRIGETENYTVHLVYQPDREFLRSAESALNAKLVEQIAASRTKGKRALVFATAKFMGQKELTEKGIEFCQLPYAIHRILGD